MHHRGYSLRVPEPGIRYESTLSFAFAYGSRERSQKFSGWLDSLMESDELSGNVAPFATMSSPVDSPSPPSVMNSDPIPDLIDFDS